MHHKKSSIQLKKTFPLQNILSLRTIPFTLIRGTLAIAGHSQALFPHDIDFIMEDEQSDQQRFFDFGTYPQKIAEIAARIQQIQPEHVAQKQEVIASGFIQRSQYQRSLNHRLTQRQKIILKYLMIGQQSASTQVTEILTTAKKTCAIDQLPNIVCLIKFIFVVVYLLNTKMKADYRSDEQLEAILSEFSIVQPKLLCDKGMPISRMCINPCCPKPSLMCQDDECENCGDLKHPQCSTFKLKAVTKLLCDRNQQQKDFILEFYKIENNFINMLHKSKLDLKRENYLGDLSEDQLFIVDNIYKKNDTKFVTGKEAEAFVNKLKSKNNEPRQNLKGLLLNNFQQSMQKYLDQILELKKGLYKSFFNGSQLSLIDSNILKNPHSADLSELKIKKEIFSERAIQDAQFLMQALNNPKRLQLLYRGSEHSFSAAAFHRKCDNICNTLTIVRTEFGKTIAGFTKYAWNTVGSGNYVHDTGRHAFLLSLDLKQKMLPISSQSLIYCHTGWGPAFGDGCDLAIADKCHNNADSSACFPTAYNGTKKYTRNQESFRALSGATNGCYFRVVEYEVFRVICQ